MQEYIYDEPSYFKGNFENFETLLSQYDFAPEEIQDDKEFQSMLTFFINTIQESPEFIPAYEYALRMVECLEPDKETNDLKASLEKTWFEACMSVAERDKIFSKQVPWGCLENRSLMRGLFWGADKMWQNGEFEKAHKLFKKILKTNKNDNIGVRYSVKATKEKMKHSTFLKRFVIEEGGGSFYNDDLRKWFGE